MKVEIAWSSRPEQPLTAPIPERNGLLLRLVRGDYCDPILDPDGWFGAAPPKVLLRHRFRLPLPFLAWRLWRIAGYIGFKVYGLDGSDAYRKFLPAEECESGSYAMCFSIRPFARA
jgi:hypothetical protein